MAAGSEKRDRFYKTPAWRRCREAVLAARHHTCEMCGKPGYIVHHIKPLTDATVDDPNIALNQNNLMVLCQSCHDSIHHQLKGQGATRPRHHEVSFDSNGNVVVADSKDPMDKR